MNAEERYREMIREQNGQHFDKQRRTKASRYNQYKDARKLKIAEDKLATDYERRSTMDIGPIDPEFFSLK